MTSPSNWWDAVKGSVYNTALTYVRTVDASQSQIYNRFARLEYLYDMNPRGGYMDVSGGGKGDGRMNENVIASNVDTVSAQIATTDIRAVFDTDGADWGEQRRAKWREWYAEALAKRLDVLPKCQRGFKAGAALKGTALNKVYVDAFDQIRVDSVLVDDIIVDELECRNGPPRQMHFRTPIEREELRAQFPGNDAAIARAATGSAQNPREWQGYRPLQRNEIMVLESWRLPIGTKDHPRYKPGRHTICIEGCDLLDEEWHKPFFPFAVMFWTTPPRGWYGIGLAERIAGLQRALNRRNLQIERQLDQGAFPTTFVPIIDARLSSQTQNTVGSIAVYKGSSPPQTVIPPVVSPETYRDADRLSSKAGEISGVSRMASQAVKPAGIETGVALREYRDQTTQRFAIQEKGYETFVLDTIVLILDCCKDLGKDAPKMLRKTRFGSKTLSWAKVDMQDVRVQIGAASTLSRTRAGREQTVVEWAQAGIISQDDARRLMDHPDLERAMSLYTAAIENVEHCLEEIADGEVVMPEPFMNLKLLIWRAQQQYLNWSADGAPEEVLENLRQLIVQAAWMESGGNSPGMQPGEVGGPTAPGPDTSMPGGGAPPSGAPAGMPPPGWVPQMPAGVPIGGPAQAAFSPQAMQLQAGV
jgi:hypothetical protein